ncbi:MAG TPA: penicillin acylase family protein [Urbifossiella sp.]|jgi:penicillin amidase|nr:penicillin acylase family protein [Urbifossiella sp.]
MNLPRLALRALFGRRLPVTAGEVRVRGVSAPVTVRRDRWGVPHIDAATAADAWFGLGFCHGQDRGGQLETYWRVGRGRLSEWVGKAGLPADRLSRRLGLRHAAAAQLPALSAEARATLEAYTAGVNAGATAGVPKPPHEFAILGGTPSAWDPADVLAFLKFQSFLLPSNWDVEFARLRILRADGADAVAALDPTVDEGVKGRRGEGVTHEGPPGPARALAADLAALHALFPRGGGSNNWVAAGGRTASGQPLLASDPHLAPLAPPPWYLAHVRTPQWEVGGGGFVGAPAFAIGQNGRAAWGVTAGLTDNTDLVLETLGPDRASVRQPDGSFVPCARRTETIRVKGGPDVVEDVLVTPRGPVVSPLFDEPGAEVLSLRAVWLDPLPLWGFLGAFRARSFDEFRRCFAEWPVLPLNVLYADAGGTVGWQLVGQVPRRAGGHGLLPRPADRPDGGWEPALVPFDDMPFQVNPPEGYLATANDPPGPAFLGADFVDPYRAEAIRTELAKRTDWDAAGFAALQTNTRSLPWEEIRPVVAALDPTDPPAREAITLLREWDGHVTADSPAAAIFELMVAELCVRVAKAKAPTAWTAALGDVGLGGAGHNLFADRRVGHLSRLLREQPAGWLPRPWGEEIADVLGGIVRTLRRNVGPAPAYWAWGHLRKLRLDHPLFGKHRLLGPAFNLGPVPCGGDQNTISQAGARPLHPTDFTHNMANLRAVFDAGDPAGSRFVLCGGQSGNPFSPHHADQLPLWQAGETIPMPWTPQQVVKAAKATLRLLPG